MPWCRKRVCAQAAACRTCFALKRRCTPSRYFRNNQNVTWNWGDPSSAAGLKPIYTDNYYWTRFQNYETDTRTRVFGNAQLDYKATSYLAFLGRVTVDSYSELQEERIAVGSQAVPGYSRLDRTFNETNYDLMANFDKDVIKDLNVKALAGLNLRKSYTRAISAATNGGLIVPGLYSVANSKVQWLQHLKDILHVRCSVCSEV